MMRATLPFAASAMIGLSTASPLPAQVIATTRYYKVVSPGRDVTMQTFFGLNPDCTSTGEYQIRVIIPPRSGRLLVDKHFDYPDYPSTNVRSACNRRRLQGTRLIYEADRGAAARVDVFDVEVIYPSSVAVRQVYGVRIE